MNSEAFDTIFNGSIKVSPDFMWLVLSIVTLIFVAISWAILFHWNKFGRRAIAIVTAEAIYLAGAVFFVLGAIASIILF